MKAGLVPAAGEGRRLGLSTPKELLEIDGKPVIEYSVDMLLEAGVDKVVVVIREAKEEILGRLIDAIKASYDAIKGHDVYFSMADTIIEPNPFSMDGADSCELTLMCFRADADNWRYFGVIDDEHHRIVDKPDRFVSDVCWGALMWRSEFTERLMGIDDFTDAINAAAWNHQVTIDRYTDIGLGPSAPKERQSRASSATPAS